uniref:O-methyltransferase FtmD n=1 Tax=Talaromyces marneffei PM1 TaxID=1077442 RepID=A0A093VIS0_TALMA
MSAGNLDQLQSYINELNSAAKVITDHCNPYINTGSASHISIPPNAPSEIHRARRNLLAVATRLQTLLAEPADFIQQLASQNQLLACLQWLGEFQVLAYIPLDGVVPVRDIAELADMPETILSKVVRMMATAGFLSQPQPGGIAPTALSAQFVTKLSYLDAAMFLAETAAPVSLKMGEATRRFPRSNLPNESAYSVTFSTSQPFQAVCRQKSKLSRQWCAYLQCAEDPAESMMDILGRLDWRNERKACMIDAGAPSTGMAMALIELYPGLHFILQVDTGVSPSGTEDFHPRIEVQKRHSGSIQAVRDAALYIVNLPALSFGTPGQSLSDRVLAELRAHLGVLRSDSSMKIILVLCLLPEPGSVIAEVEAAALARDLYRLQLGNEHEMGVAEIVEMVNNVQDNMGGLVVVNKLNLRNSATVALAIQYQANTVRLQGTQQARTGFIRNGQMMNNGMNNLVNLDSGSSLT